MTDRPPDRAAESAASESLRGSSIREASEADRRRNEFLANLSHELRTPLHAIIGFAELMFRGKVGPVSDDQREYLGDILDSSRHLLELVDGLSGFAQAERRVAPRPEPEVTRHELAGGTRLGTSVLVVDDNEASAKLARVVLEHEGYEVRTAANAEEALRVLSLRIPWLVLIDVQLPGMDGLELTRRLRADAATKDLVILALTASTTMNDEEGARAAGCDGFIAKPMDIRSLARIVREHLGARPPLS